MKIVIISTYFGQEHHGGAAVSTRLLVDELKKDHDVYILTSTKKEVPGYNTIPLRFFKRFPSLILRLDFRVIYNALAKDIEKALKEIKPDIVHIQEFEMMVSTIKVTSKLNIPTIVTARDHRFVCSMPCCEAKGILRFKCSRFQQLKCLMGLSKKQFGFALPGFIIFPLMMNKTKAFRKYVRKADFVIAISDFLKNNLIKIGVDKEKIKTIYNPAPNWKTTKTKKNKKLTIFAPGRLEDYKGFHILIKTFNQIIKENKDVRLIITGTGSYEYNLKKLTNRLNLNDNIEFTGKQPYEKLKELYFNSDIVAFPSIWPESFGRVSIEAMAAGKPIIASRVGGIPEVVTKDVGILVKPNDVEELTKAIVRLIKNPKLRKSMGKKGLTYVKKFNKKDYCRDVIDVYNTNR